MKPSETCTSHSPCLTALYHVDAVIKSREVTGHDWPTYSCPNCKLEILIPELDTKGARKLLGDGG